MYLMDKGSSFIHTLCCLMTYAAAGVGFGSVMAKARSVTDDMFVAASAALAACVSNEQLQQKRMYPEIRDLRSVSLKVSHGV